MVILGVLGRQTDVNRGKKAENQGLHADDDDAEHHDGQRQSNGEEAHKNTDQEVVDSDVEHQPNGQGDGPNTRRNKLDGEHQAGEQHVGPKLRKHAPASHMLEVVDAVLAQPIIVKGQEDEDGATCCDVEVAGRGQKAWNEPDSVRDEDENRTRSNDGKEALGVLGSHDIGRGVVEKLEEDLEKRRNRQLRLGIGRGAAQLVALAGLPREIQDERHDEQRGEQRLGLLVPEVMVGQRVPVDQLIQTEAVEYVVQKRDVFGHGRVFTLSTDWAGAWRTGCSLD